VQGVNAGDEIAVNGFDKLQNGAKVTITKASSSGGSNGSSGGSGATNGTQAPASPNASPSTSGGAHP
jgi:hypothetical protein